MRLRIIYEILQLHAQDLSLSADPESGGLRVSRIQSTVKAVREIEKTGVLKHEIRQIPYNVFESSLDSIFLDPHTYAVVDNVVTNLRNKAYVLWEVLNDLLTQESEDSISFKIPDNSQFSDISKIIDKLNKILEQSLVNDYIKGEIKFQGFESGSSWIRLTVGGMLALQFFGGMVDLIYDWKTRQQEFVVKEKMIEDLDVQVDIKKTVYDALNKEKDEAFKARLSQLKENAEIPSNDHDIDERLKYAIKALTELLDKGLEVHPSLTAPPEIRKQFPDAAEISETLKLLTPTKLNGADLENKILSDDQQ